LTNRERFIEYVKHGGDEFICSPQIGAGAGFDARLSGKAWISEVTQADTKRVCETFEMTPLYNAGLPGFPLLGADASIETEKSWDDVKKRRHTVSRIITPRGELVSRTAEEERMGVVTTKSFITDEDELDILEYIIDSALEMTDFSRVSSQIREARAELGDDDALDIQWPMQPYELLTFPNVADTAVFTMLYPDVCVRLMDKILRLDEKLLQAASLGGADFVFLGGPGSEMISPRFYEDYLVPYSKTISEMAHQNGLLIYSHICSPIEPMLSMGFYNKMGIDLFETLSEAPAGNIKSIEDAFSKLSPEICTRGNIGIDKMLLSSAKEIKDDALHILGAARSMGRKHILACSDYLVYDVPEENVRALAEAVIEFNGKNIV
jgi:hypothetical protein